MSFFLASMAAGFLGVLFAVLAFRYAQVLCLHLLAIWVYFIAAPLATAWLFTGHVVSRALIGQDLYSFELAASLAAHSYLFVLYGLGVLVVAIFFHDHQLIHDVRRTLAAQKLSIAWPIAFTASLLTDLLFRVRYGIFLSGSHTLERMADTPYLVTSLLAVLGPVIFGLFGYLCILSARSKPLLFLCLTYLPYELASSGRRDLTMALVTLFLLRGLSLGFKPTWRLAGIGAMALGLFILVGPVFKEARAIWQVQQDAGVPPLTALMDGIGEGTARFLRGEAGFSEVATNVAERGNAGVFFLSVAERHVPPQHGRMTWASILWVVPSVFITKPAEQVEAMRAGRVLHAFPGIGRAQEKQAADGVASLARLVPTGARARRPRGVRRFSSRALEERWCGRARSLWAMKCTRPRSAVAQSSTVNSTSA